MSRTADAALVLSAVNGRTDGKGEYMTPAKSVLERDGARKTQSPCLIWASWSGVGSAMTTPPMR
eukprot:2558259-Pleurochrysis_carterae.AAC.1